MDLDRKETDGLGFLDTGSEAFFWMVRTVAAQSSLASCSCLCFRALMETEPVRWLMGELKRDSLGDTYYTYFEIQYDHSVSPLTPWHDSVHSRRGLLLHAVD